MAHGLEPLVRPPAEPDRSRGAREPKGASRRIFSPRFKLQVLDSYRRDSDCRGNQRATARKYGIHRRQIQKWLQMETALRAHAAPSSPPTAPSASESDDDGAASDASDRALDLTSRRRFKLEVVAAFRGDPLVRGNQRPTPARPYGVHRRQVANKWVDSSEGSGDDAPHHPVVPAAAPLPAAAAPPPLPPSSGCLDLSTKSSPPKDLYRPYDLSPSPPAPRPPPQFYPCYVHAAYLPPPPTYLPPPPTFSAGFPLYAPLYSS